MIQKVHEDIKMSGRDTMEINSQFGEVIKGHESNIIFFGKTELLCRVLTSLVSSIVQTDRRDKFSYQRDETGYRWYYRFVLVRVLYSMGFQSWNGRGLYNGFLPLILVQPLGTITTNGPQEQGLGFWILLQWLIG